MSGPHPDTCPHCGRTLAGARESCESCRLDRCRDTRLQRTVAEMQLELVEALVEALDAREHETGMHSKRVACHTLVLAHAAGEAAEACRQIYYGSLLHDIGKIAVPDAVLLKAGPLTESEWVEMKRHPEAGYRIIAHLPFLAEAASIVLCHEERWDGSGYPRGLKGEAIPWGARLFAIIDTLDAMTSDRPYRRALPFDEARREIERRSGSQFDPAAVELFRSCEGALREMVQNKCFIPDDHAQTWR